MSFRIFIATAIVVLTTTWYTPVLAEQDAAEGEAGAEKAELPAFHQPVFITDIGQGNTARLVEVMLRRGGKVEFKSDALANVEDIEGAKTLVLGVGGSTKGLGAAGLDATAEMERTRALIKAAEDAEIPIIGVHMGGMPRRGELSDLFIRLVYENSAAFVLWEGGDEDGFFTRLKENNEEPLPVLEVVATKPGVGEKLEELLAKQPEDAEVAEATE